MVHEWEEDPGSPIDSGTGSEKIPPQHLRDTEDDTSAGNILEYVGAEPFPPSNPPLLMVEGPCGRARLRSFTFQ